MWCSKVLVAYDGSRASHKALELATDIVRDHPEVEVVLVHVMRLYSSGMAASGAENVFVDDAAEVRDELELLAGTLPNPASVRILTATAPASRIVSCALEEGCDLIIMGSRGQGGVKGYLGSVSYAVTKESPITVLIAKDGEGR